MLFYPTMYLLPGRKEIALETMAEVRNVSTAVRAMVASGVKPQRMSIAFQKTRKKMCIRYIP